MSIMFKNVTTITVMALFCSATVAIFISITVLHTHCKLANSNKSPYHQDHPSEPRHRSLNHLLNSDALKQLQKQVY